MFCSLETDAPRTAGRGVGVMSRVQPVPAPSTQSEYAAIRHLLIDTAGAPLRVTHCARCRVEHFTVEPHLDEVPCPACGSVHARCVRPSGHDAAAWHRDRVAAFDRLRDEREAAGVAQVAPWAR